MNASFKKNNNLDILSEGIHFNSNHKETFRTDFLNLTNFTKEKLGQNKLLLTNDIHSQIWWIFSDEKRFYFPYVFFVG